VATIESHTARYRSMRATILPGPKVAVAACKDKRSSRHVYRIARKLELGRGPELVLLRTTAVYPSAVQRAIIA
jgi:hypothetical protein